MSSWSSRVDATHEPEQKVNDLGTHLAIYSKYTLGAGFQQLMTERLANALRGIDTRVERVVVRFEDLNGPKGGPDTACRIQLVISGRRALVVEARADGEGKAFRLALPRLSAALARLRDRERSRPRATLRLLHAFDAPET